MKTLNQQCNLPLAAILVAALFAPLQASAVMPAPVTQIGSQASVSDSHNGLRGMAEADLGRVSAQGLTDDVLGQYRDAEDASKGDGIKVIGKLNSALNKRLNFLDMETSLKDVVCNTVRAQAIINPDGSITQILPSSIGEISFEHIRVKGNTAGPSFGSISIRGIDLASTALTLSPKR